MNVQAIDPSPVPEPRGGPPRFTYPSGSRPLEGYTIKRGVGRGGFGEVYYATSDGGKEVALKLIRRNLEVELRGVSHCLNLKHPHLVSLYDIKQDDHGDSWVVMEYVSGECLEDVISRNPDGMPIPEVLAWMHGIGAGVAYLHDRGIVHRDLKPGNIFSDEGLVKIGDYGLSKFISCSRRSGQTESVGTVHYMAPEVANGRYGKEIDIYALGVMLYEMLTGHVPFDGESVGEVLMKHLTAEPDVSRLQEPYRTLVARALTKDPDKRLKSVNDLLAALPQPALPQVRVNPQATKPRPGNASPAVVVASTPAAATEAEEPILRALHAACRQLHHGWTNSNMGAPLKVVLLLLGIFVLINTAPVIVTALIVIVPTYAVYRLIRGMLVAKPAPLVASPAATNPPMTPPLRPTQPHPSAVAKPVAQPARPVAARRFERPVPAMIVKSPREKLTEACGAMLMAAVVSVVLCVVMELLLKDKLQLNQYAWLTLVGTVGAWGVLIPSKFWEGSDGDSTIRRFVLLLVGLLVGAFAWGVQEHLAVTLPAMSDAPHVVEFADYHRSLFSADGQSNLKGYMAYFAFLFPVLRWWRLADPLRTARLGVWATVVCITWAWLLNMVWPFSQPWGVMVAATIAIATQLASPWVEFQRRTDFDRAVEV